MRACVLDASALASILFAEPGGDEVAAKIDGRDLAAPDLIRYEIANVCLSKLKQNISAKLRVRKQFQTWERLGIKLYSLPSQMLVHIASRRRLTAYDAAYLALAQALKAELLTLDTRLEAAWKSTMQPRL